MEIWWICALTNPDPDWRRQFSELEFLKCAKPKKTLAYFQNWTLLKKLYLFDQVEFVFGWGSQTGASDGKLDDENGEENDHVDKKQNLVVFDGAIKSHDGNEK